MSICLESVSMVSMGESIINDVSLTVERGTLNVLLGPTQAGKTTLMRLMAGLDKPTSGRILADGKDATGVPVRQRSVAMEPPCD
jgi:glycerol transport system ATP-binding protein